MQVLLPDDLPGREVSALGDWAVQEQTSRGRRYPEIPAPTRTDFQRDRDRIVHCTAFRRLVYKTQVFLNHEGDLFRTRLTHSLEVAQLGRSIARSLRLNEDLVEAIALSHDLGHTPFGHAGQDALNNAIKHQVQSMARGDGGPRGFEHNLQSLRVVDHLEERYPAFDGLNLTYETREGILKHCSRRNAEALAKRDDTGLADRFFNGGSPSLEAQLCNLADEIAYNAHDIDDGVRSGLLTLDQVRTVPLFNHFCEKALHQHPSLAGRRLLFESIRLMLSQQVYDVIATTWTNITKVAPSAVDEVRQNKVMVTFSPEMERNTRQLKAFLLRNLYRHPQVLETTGRARQIVNDLFRAYLAQSDEMPPAHATATNSVQAVTDYIAGMTDRFAIREHERLYGLVLFP